MIRHIFKIIWNERKTNTWVIFEYVLVFCILWFCTDFLFYMNKKHLEPRGFDIENVYKIQIARIPDRLLNEKQRNEIIKDERTAAYTIMERLKRYPGIEAVSFSNMSIPYSFGNAWGQFYSNKDSVNYRARLYNVSDEYFDVFKIDTGKGNILNWLDPGESNKIMISPDYKNEIFGFPVKDVQSVKQYTGPSAKRENDPVYEIGITGKIKQNDYGNYKNIIFFPIDNNFLSEICIRVSPSAGDSFIDRFINDMDEQLAIGDLYLQTAEPLSEQREIINMETKNTLSGVYSVTVFLIINIFLGIIGTFWFRTQARQNQIGLRIALGASRKKVKSTFLIETFLLLFSASIPATIICLNIGQTDFLEIIGVPRINREENPVHASQDLINYVLTFLFLAVISLIAVWYPANQAAGMQPSEALRDE